MNILYLVGSYEKMIENKLHKSKSQFANEPKSYVFLTNQTVPQETTKPSLDAVEWENYKTKKSFNRKLKLYIQLNM